MLSRPQWTQTRNSLQRLRQNASRMPVTGEPTTSTKTYTTTTLVKPAPRQSMKQRIASRKFLPRKDDANSTLGNTRFQLPLVRFPEKNRCDTNRHRRAELTLA